MAYAAVISLKHTIDRLRIELTMSEDRDLGILRSTLEGLDDRRHIKINRSLINKLEAEISEAAYKLEDACEFYMLNRSRPRSDSLDQMWPPIAESDLESLKQEKISFFTTVKELAEEYIRVLDNPLPWPRDEEEHAADALKMKEMHTTAAVKLSDLVEKIKKELLNSDYRPKYVTLVGMAGIGKTHLARKIFHDPFINQHFEVTTWVRIGQHPNLEKVRRDVVGQVEIQRICNQRKNIIFSDCDYQIQSECRYINKGNKVLFGGHFGYALGVNFDEDFRIEGKYERHLLVLDDVWSTDIYRYVEDLLPSRGGLRILVTTRLEKIPTCRARPTRIYRMPFLDKEQSWSLLRQIVFADDDSISSQLEKAGRMIADICEGLPLLILTVAHILRGNDINEDYWKKVADKKTTTFPDAFEQIYEVLILSFDYLPQYLKACFLYMGVFPQTFVIPITKLRDLSIVEDFMDPVKNWNYVTELVENNIVIVCKESSENGIKSSKLHSVYWYLCVKEARKVKFFHALNKLTDVSIESQPRRLSFQNNVLFGIKEVYDSMAANSPSTTRSLLCTGEYHQYPVRICYNMILLKVLDALAIRFYEFPSEILNLLELRYLALTHDGVVPTSINKLQNMQFLILRQHHNIRLVRHSTYLPEGIWDMDTLLNLQIRGCNLPDPPSERVRLHSLVTLHVNADSCSEKVFKGINSHLEKLRITIELEPDAAKTLSCFEHIDQLHNLQSLKCVVVNPQLMSQVVAPPDHLSKFSVSLRKLSLNGLGYSWKNISVIGLLPDLRVLKLRCNAFQGPEWKSRFGEFKCLQVLVLEDIDLVNWTLKDGSQETFPWLQRLILRHCYKLKEIPKIRNLETLEVVDCSPSLVASAEQRRSSSLPVVITASWNFH